MYANFFYKKNFLVMEKHICYILYQIDNSALVVMVINCRRIYGVDQKGSKNIMVYSS